MTDIDKMRSNQPERAVLPAPTRSTASDSEDQLFHLNGRLTLNEVEDRVHELVNLSSGGSHIRLDTSGLDAIDIAGLQLVLALRNSLRSQHRRLRLASQPQGALLATLIAAGFCEVEANGRTLMFRDQFWRGGD